MRLIECKEVTLGYQGVAVTAPISFHVNKGDYLCVVGENGSGKTTLIKTLLGLIHPLSGEIQWNEGCEKRSLGYLPQLSESESDFPATAEEIIFSGLRKRSRFSFRIGRAERKRAEKQAERLGITNLLRKPFSTLSGGQQRRVLLARALCAGEEILLLDEPTAGLDPEATEELYSVIEELNRREGVTVLMITHDLAAARRFATSILHMGEEFGFFADAEAYFLDGNKGGESHE